MVTFTRTLLHEAVWSHPLNVIIREHGVPYEEIVRACKLMQIPRPKPGYWRINGVIEEPPPPPPLSEAPGAAVEATLRLRIPRPKRPAEEGDSVPVSEEEHPLIVSTRKAMAKARVDYQGMGEHPYGKKVLAVRVSPPQLERSLDIYTLLIGTLNQSGAELEVSRKDKHCSYKTWVLLDGERIGLELVERLSIIDRDASPTRDKGLYQWRSLIRQYHPTGRLALRLRCSRRPGTDPPGCVIAGPVRVAC